MILFRFVLFRFVSFRFIAFRFVAFRSVSFRCVSFRFRFLLYRDPQMATNYKLFKPPCRHRICGLCLDNRNLPIMLLRHFVSNRMLFQDISFQVMSKILFRQFFARPLRFAKYISSALRIWEH